MKRTLSIVLVFVLLLSAFVLASCKGTDKDAQAQAAAIGQAPAHPETQKQRPGMVEQGRMPRGEYGGPGGSGQGIGQRTRIAGDAGAKDARRQGKLRDDVCHAVMMVWAAARRQACITVSAERGAQRRERPSKSHGRSRTCLRPSSMPHSDRPVKAGAKNTIGSPLVLGPALQGRHVQQLHPPPLQADVQKPTETNGTET